MTRASLLRAARTTSWARLCALGLLLAPHAAPADEVDPVAALLGGRSDERAAADAVSRLAALAGEPGAPASARVALLRARFFWAESYLAGQAQRAAYRRNVREGLAQLTAAAATPLRSFADLDSHLARIPTHAVGLLYWTALSHASGIPSLPLLQRLGAAQQFRRALERACALDERYFYAGPHRCLASYLARAPRLLGGDMDAALAHVRRAVALAPEFAQTQVDHAEIRILAGAPPRQWQPGLRATLALPPPDGASRPEHEWARRRAAAILGGAEVD